jgi:two-component sensor histidine kinase
MTPERLEFLENPRRLVSANIRGPVSEAWVVIISEPVFDTDRYIGAVSISIPNAVLANASRSRQSDEVPADHPIEMATFNRRGEFLSTLSGAPTPDVTLLPRQELTALIAEAPRAFTAESRGGEVQTYTMTPVVPDEVYVIGVWEPELPRLGRLPTPVAAVLFPLLMWVASLVVASIAMHRLVLVHVEALRSKMRKFGRSRTLDTAIPKNGTPAEFREMDAEFMAMAESVLRDEAQLEDAVREKNILLKEIHHRVKNNLQLLSSITSMKRRRADSPEARAVLRALQDRILSLAAIHRNLYLSTDMSAVEAGRLIEDIAAQHGILPGQGRLHMALEPVVLVPQQAVPLSLLVAEALGGGNTADETTPVEIGLSIAADQMVTLVIETGPPARAADDSDAAIGENLIVAFADQLGGSLDRRESDHGRSRITLSFRALETVPDALDY